MIIRNSIFHPLHKGFSKCFTSSTFALQPLNIYQTQNHNQKRSAHIIPRKKPHENTLMNVPYEKIVNLQEGAKSIKKTKKDPSDKLIILIGGESSFYVGMCESSLDHPEIYQAFQQAEQVFGWNLMDMCINGPKEEIIKTKHLLPCVFMANFTALHLAKQKTPNLEQQLVAMTSMGIGELNALVFLESMRFEDALQYLKVRTDAMAFLAERSNTRSLLIWETAATNTRFMCRAAREWCLRKGISERDAFCEITHFLHPETKVIGGHSEAIDFILKNRENFKLQRTYELSWDLAYYSSYLKPIGDILSGIIDKFTFREPPIILHSTTGLVYVKKMLLQNLSEQVWKPVNLERNFTFMYNRDKKKPFPHTLECAAKRSISISLRQHNLTAYKKCRTVFAT